MFSEQTQPTGINPNRYYRVAEIANRPAVTAAQAERNRERGTGVRRARPATRGIFPISPATWWNWIKRGVVEPGKKFGPSCTVWSGHYLLELSQRIERGELDCAA